MITDKMIIDSIKYRKFIINGLQGTMALFHARAQVDQKRPNHRHALAKADPELQGSLIAVNEVLNQKKMIKKEKRMLRKLRKKRTVN